MTAMSILNLTSNQLRQAADLQDKIAAFEKQLAGILGTEAAPVEAAKPAKRQMSAAHKAKIRQAQKLRWAKYNAAKAKPAAQTTAVKLVETKAAKKGGMSAAGRARIVAAQKARWAVINAAKTAASTSDKPAAPKPAKKKFVMSAAAKAKISAAAKARWAAKKAAEAKK